MAELIATGTTEADSSDFTLSSGASTTLYLKDAGGLIPASCTAAIQIKSGSLYFNVGELNGTEPVKVLSATGTFRVRKFANAATFGVDRD